MFTWFLKYLIDWQDMTLFSLYYVQLVQLNTIWFKSHILLGFLYWYVVVWEIWGNPIISHSQVTLCHDLYWYVVVWEIWGNPIISHSQVTLCHDLYWYVVVWEIWGNPIISQSGNPMSWPLLICCGVGDLRKPHYQSQ